MEKIRLFLWKILGIKYYKYLKHKKHVHLKESTFAKIGKATYDNGAYVWRWSSLSTLEIGNYCSIASDVHFICDSGFHTISQVTNFPLFNEILSKNDKVVINGKAYVIESVKDELHQEKSNIKIGNDVWIGANVTILPGVTIENGATILAGSVVSKDVPSYAVVGGIPATLVKYKHDEMVIKQLNEIAWWNWSDEKLKQKINDFYLPINQFVAKHK
jgi:acetyltransferase-like isoleucine patch superfamily enzyme